MDIDIEVTGGVVRGRNDAELVACRGIPFATLPARFAAPGPVQAWEGVRETASFGAPPPQSGLFGMDGLGQRGDDWLTVNVWSPDLAGTLPVMVWIQGGGYVFGWSGLPEYDGGTLARGGVVVVTFNYRVGLEGFGYVRGLPANRGLLDQVAALAWVQENIRSFGGDPARVTVFGQSAGGGSVAALLAMHVRLGCSNGPLRRVSRAPTSHLRWPRTSPARVQPSWVSNPRSSRAWIPTCCLPPATR